MSTAPDPFTLRLLRYVPRNVVSRAFGRVAKIVSPASIPRWLIRTWITKFRVDVTEAEKPPEQYRTLLEFFTRALREGARPIDAAADSIASPVDGTLGAMGAVDGDTLLQAKGMTYSAAALLGSRELAAQFAGGSYLTVYLSPRDYHRIHSPSDGVVARWLYEPGTLWPVNPPSVRRIPSLFAVNERITVWIDTPSGPLALVLVGATNVGSIRLAFGDFATNRGGAREARELTPPIAIRKGDHVATFELGSTIVLLVPRGVALDPMWENAKVRMGQRIGRWSNTLAGAKALTQE